RRQQRRQGRAHGFVRDILAAVEYMNLCLTAGIAFAETYSNCLVVYYEDLVSDPLLAANRMYRFIGVHELEQLDLANEEFEPPRNRESWIDWSTPEGTRKKIEQGRVGIAESQLTRGEWDFVCAKTIRHPLLSKRYSIPPVRWTVAARWCVARCLALRSKDR